MSTPSRAVAGLALAILTASVGTSAANVALPALVTAFTATPGQVQWVVVAYLLAVTSISVTAGSAGDRWGRRRVLLAGISIFTVGAVAGALAPSLVTLVIARGVQGVGAAVMTALPLALARDLVADGRTGRIMGLLGTTSAVGTALGPALGGALIGWGGWTAPFWMMALLGAAALPLAGRP
ncbi:MFS transporter, partial [Microbacterium sp. B24]|uniref:MFS transporter n=1 Tax=Microbacterium sp. B24 TaxID=95616 RepID=UPI000562D2BE